MPPFVRSTIADNPGSTRKMIMAIDTERKLHWTQRIALVCHNLHAARRTGDFTFFKTLQAHALIEGTLRYHAQRRARR